MTAAQTLYVMVFFIYLLFFLLFARFFVWKNYSEKNYWDKKPNITQKGLENLAENLGKKVPFISILVPARNESVVIENTIRHLAVLKYPQDLLEILVITDEKEVLDAHNERLSIIQEARKLIENSSQKQFVNPEVSQKTTEVIIAALSDFALAEFLSKKFNDTYSLGIPELCMLPAKQRLIVVRDICIEIIKHNGKAKTKALRDIVRQACPWLSKLDVERVYPASLAIALPVLTAYTQLFDDTNRSALKKTTNNVARAGYGLTQDTIFRMAEFIAMRVAMMLTTTDNIEKLMKNLSNAIKDMYPTTQEIVTTVQRDLKRQLKPYPEIKHIIVPFDFDGTLDGIRTGVNVPSTKGRALNWGLEFLDPCSQICGFYDAESRPHGDVLLYVGYRHLLDPKASRILQGPVFQVRNFYKMSAFCRIAALYQAIAHDWYLPWLFQTLPFVGGTNVFVERKLLIDIEGWDCTVLTEDLELGVRAYLMGSAWPEYLPYHSSEQTPPNFRAFFKQRLRWGTGHLQVVDKITDEPIGEPRKRYKLKVGLMIKGQLEWAIYQLATFVPPVAMILHYRKLLDPHIIPSAGHWMLSTFSLVYMGFTIYAFRRYNKYIDSTAQPENFKEWLEVYFGLLMLPLAAFMFPVPYTAALVLKTFGKEPRVWVKTPRTGESRLAV